MTTSDFKDLVSDDKWDKIKDAINNGFDLNQNDEYHTPIMLRLGSAPLV